MKTCTKCLKELPESVFKLKKNSRNISSKRCNACRESPSVLWNQKNSDRMKAAAQKFKNSGKSRQGRLKAMYGMTHEEYLVLFEKQQYSCAICKCKEPGGRWKHFHVDHDHKTGIVRGLLCTNCNRAIGYMNDDVWRLEQSIRYLSK